jgi:hypothetical protein
MASALAPEPATWILGGDERCFTFVQHDIVGKSSRSGNWVVGNERSLDFARDDGKEMPARSSAGSESLGFI